MFTTFCHDFKATNYIKFKTISIGKENDGVSPSSKDAICLQNLRRTLQYETLNNMVKQTAYSIEPTYNIKNSIYSIHHTAYSIQHKAYRVQHTPYSIQYATYGIQCTAYNMQNATYSLQRSSDTHTAYEWYECGYYFWKTLKKCNLSSESSENVTVRNVE